MQRCIGIDVHSKSSTIYVMSAAGKKVRQNVLETNGQALIGYLAQIPGQLHVCLEEGEWSARLYEILEPRVAKLVVEEPQKKTGSKSDAIDACDLADHLRTGQIKTEVYKALRLFTRPTGSMWIDVSNGGFGGSASLANSDFEAAAGASQVATRTNAASNGDWSEGSLNAAGLAAINSSGVTQLRFYFDLDDNDDRGNDYIGYYSANNGTASNHPELVIEYQP